MTANSFAISKIWDELSGAGNSLPVEASRQFGILFLRTAEALVEKYAEFGYITNDEKAMFAFKIMEMKRQHNVTAFS